MLAIRGLRMVDWLATFAKQAAAAAAASKTLGTATTGAVAQSKTALGTLPMAFTGVGIAITAAIAGWGLYEALVGPVEDAIRRIEDFKQKYGKGFSGLKPGQERFETLQGRIRDLRKARSGIGAIETVGSAGVSPHGAGVQAQQTIEAKRRRDEIDAEIKYLEKIQAQQVRKEHGVYGRSDVGLRRYTGEQSMYGPGEESWAYQTTAGGGPAYEQFIAEQLAMYQGERSKLEEERDKTYEKFEKAAGDERTALHEELGNIAERMKDNADAIQGYTDDLDGIAKSISDSQSKERVADVAKTVEKERSRARRGAFKGGRSTPLDPFATPLFSGQDPEGKRITNLILQKGGAAQYFKQSPGARQELARTIGQKQNVINVHFGDSSISITAPPESKPRELAKMVNREIEKLGRRNYEDVQRVLGSTVPAEI